MAVTLTGTGEEQPVSNKPRLSVAEKASLAARLLTVVPLKAGAYVVRCGGFALRRGLVLRYYLQCALLRVILASFSSQEIQYLFPTSQQTYQAWIERKARRNEEPSYRARLVRHVQPLELTDSAIFWIGDRIKASKFVLYFYSGGFVVPLSPAHLDMCWEVFVKTGIEAGVEVAVGVLPYTLAPHGRFPVQLCEAASALGTLLDAGVCAGDIIISGASAGGNLVLQLVGHLLHPQPLARRIDLAEPLAALFAISPWIGLDVTTASYRDNDACDMLSATIMESFALEYLGGARKRDEALAGGNPWVAPLQAAEGWLQGAEKLASKAYVSFGGREVLADDFRALVDELRRSSPALYVESKEARDEAHDFSFVEAMAGQHGGATARLKQWFGAVIATE